MTPPSYRRGLAPGRSLADAVVNRHGPNGLLVVRVGMVSTVGAVTTTVYPSTTEAGLTAYIWTNADSVNAGYVGE